MMTNDERQNYSAWFTDYPSTHERAGETVEVVPRALLDEKAVDVFKPCEWRVVDANGSAVDEGLDVAWVVYDSFTSAMETRDRFEDEAPEGAPYRVEMREVGRWSPTTKARVL